VPEVTLLAAHTPVPVKVPVQMLPSSFRRKLPAETAKDELEALVVNTPVKDEVGTSVVVTTLDPTKPKL
jgi:hypothetical protein